MPPEKRNDVGSTEMNFRKPGSGQGETDNKKEGVAHRGTSLT